MIGLLLDVVSLLNSFSGSIALHSSHDGRSIDDSPVQINAASLGVFQTSEILIGGRPHCDGSVRQMSYFGDLLMGAKRLTSWN